MRKQLSAKLAAVIDKYRSHPQFLGVNIVDANQRGALDDTLLHIASSRGAVADIAVLVASGAQVNAVGDLGYTPLHHAAMGGRVAAVQKLLEFGADPEIKNEYGENPIQVAENGGHEDVARILRTHLLGEL
jgi:ankyrin repeat protein